MLDGSVRAPLALVTGGHRRLGGVIAEHLARAGYDLAVHGSHDVELDPALADALSDAGVRWHGFIADFNAPASVIQLMDQVAAHFGRAPDVLVNSAALFGQDHISTVTQDDLIDHYTVNCIAPVLLTQAFVGLATGDPVGGKAGRSRAIINILDQRLYQPHGDQLAYSLSKHALDGFTQIAARSLAPHVRVNGVAPGLTIPTTDYAPEQMDRLSRFMPLELLPSPAEIAQAVLYLAQAQAVTGQVICVDGGAHMKSFSKDFMHL